MPIAPILEAKDHAAPSVFRAENLLREARRQKGLPVASVPDVCVLDPDGDLVRALRHSGRAEPDTGWACYHTVLDRFVQDGEVFGIIGCAVGAAFAVLVAEQLFASGCRLLLSMTSAGRIGAGDAVPRFALIDRALRDEGTSYHYLPPAAFATADPALVAAVIPALRALPLGIAPGATWTTDAPYRETAAAIAHAASLGLVAVEMEAAALYAFAQATRRDVLCFAHITNAMAQAEGDFEKGDANGTGDVLRILSAAARAWRNLGNVPAEMAK